MVARVASDSTAAAASTARTTAIALPSPLTASSGANKYPARPLAAALQFAARRRPRCGRGCAPNPSTMTRAVPCRDSAGRPGRQRSGCCRCRAARPAGRRVPCLPTSGGRTVVMVATVTPFDAGRPGSAEVPMDSRASGVTRRHRRRAPPPRSTAEVEGRGTGVRDAKWRGSSLPISDAGVHNALRAGEDVRASVVPGCGPNVGAPSGAVILAPFRRTALLDCTRLESRSLEQRLDRPCRISRANWHWRAH